MEDYTKALNDLGLSHKEMQIITNYGSVINDNSPFVYRAKSKIDGEGMFAQEDIKKDAFLGLASTTIPVFAKTFLGRYTNHSFNANIKFIPNKDYAFSVWAIKDIKKDEEVLVDYTNHVPSKKEKKIEF